MKRALAGWLLVCALAAPAVGDRVILKDGRSFEGTVKEADGKILVELAYGTISFTTAEVERIDRMPTAADQLDLMLSRIDRADPNALFQAAAWARENDLVRRSDELLKEVLSLNPDHAGAHKLLCRVKADGKWLDLPTAIQLVQSKLEGDKAEELLSGVMPALLDLPCEAQPKLQLKELEGQCRLRVGQFEQAQKSYEYLAGKASGSEVPRYAAIAEILKAHPDGMYVLADPYPATSGVLSAAPAAEEGPASLSRPAVLAGALRDAAKAQIKAGQALLEEGKKLELTEPEAAKTKYSLAGRNFDAADAIVPNFARSYRVEIARRLIALVTKDMNTEAGKFDALKAELAKREISPAAYSQLLQKMLRSLGNVRADLDTILQLAAPFERELVLEITDANLRLTRVNGLRDLLTQELHGK